MSFSQQSQQPISAPPLFVTWSPSPARAGHLCFRFGKMVGYAEEGGGRSKGASENGERGVSSQYATTCLFALAAKKRKPAEVYGRRVDVANAKRGR